MMKTKEVLDLLGQHSQKALVFEYQPGKYIRPNYHITEVKNITVDAMDCGGNPDFWKETIVQIYENPDDLDRTDFMTVQKAADILKRVDAVKPMVREAEIKFEYSNPQFHTAQLFVADTIWNDEKLIFKLAVEKTDCKAKETCGITEPQAVTHQNNCAPGSGCC